MYLIAGKIELHVLLVYRQVFTDLDEALEALNLPVLSPYNFLEPMTLLQITELEKEFGSSNVLLVPTTYDIKQEKN